MRFIVFLVIPVTMMAAQCAQKTAPSSTQGAQPTAGATAQPVPVGKGVPPQTAPPPEGTIPKEVPIGAAPGAPAPQGSGNTQSAAQKSAPAGKKQ